jgi:hypothetical protein
MPAKQLAVQSRGNCGFGGGPNCPDEARAGRRGGYRVAVERIDPAEVAVVIEWGLRR